MLKMSQVYVKNKMPVQAQVNNMKLCINFSDFEVAI